MPQPQIWLRTAIENATDCDAFPVSAPEGQDPPYVIYTWTSTEREVLLSDAPANPASGSSVPPTGEFTVEVFADDYVDVWTRAGQIVGAIHGYSGGGIVLAVVTDERDGSPERIDGRDGPTYVVEITGRITFDPA